MDKLKINKAPSEDNGSAYAHCQTKSRGKREYEIGQWPLDSLCNEIYLQLDSKWIKDKKMACGKESIESASDCIHTIHQ